jgi:hypothetical protein
VNCQRPRHAVLDVSATANGFSGAGGAIVLSDPFEHDTRSAIARRRIKERKIVRDIITS